jgi:hypothetical protein
MFNFEKCSSLKKIKIEKYLDKKLFEFGGNRILKDVQIKNSGLKLIIFRNG